MVKDSNGDPIASYTQDDVEELAKVMTGYDIKGNSKYGKPVGQTEKNGLLPWNLIQLIMNMLQKPF